MTTEKLSFTKGGDPWSPEAVAFAAQTILEEEDARVLDAVGTMTRRTNLSPLYVKFMPDSLREGTLYISHEFKTAIHLCCCGCGQQVVTPFSDKGWTLSEKDGSVSLYPSIGNWQMDCKSHYWIQQNKINWA